MSSSCSDTVSEACTSCGAIAGGKGSKSQDKSKDKSGKGGAGKKFDDLAKMAAVSSGRPITFIVAILIIIIWGVTGPIFKFNDTWQLVINTSTTIITFLMVFLIQNSQNRDSCAMQIKLDEIIRALNEAGNNLMDLEDKSEEELEELKKSYLDMAHEAVSRIERHREGDDDENYDSAESTQRSQQDTSSKKTAA